jgi:hypothetical protein
MQKVLARVLSRVLDPVWEVPLALLLAIAFAVREGLRWRFVGLLLFIDFVVPFIFFLLMIKHGQISNWDTDSKAQRLPILFFGLLCNLGGLWLAHALGKTELMSVLIVYYLIAIVFFLITIFWKISLHAGINAILITSLNMFYGWRYPWLYLFLLAVMWARVYERHHTWMQVTLGALLGTGMVIGGLGMVY